jgi:hypothetical protein
MAMRLILSVLMSVALSGGMLSACKPERSEPNVWRSYDYHYPVSPDAGLAPVQNPPPLYPPTRQVYDNDDTYKLPVIYGLCNDDALNAGCH